LGLLRLPEELRSELSKPLGFLLENTIDNNVAYVLNLIREKNPPKVIIVGDYVLSAFIKYSYIPDIGIFDKKSKRLPFQLNINPDICIKNPAGHLSDEAIEIIKNALNSQKKLMIYVEGEEDLLALPAIIFSPTNSFIIYGLMNRGMVIVINNKEKKIKLYEILNRFERV
jgi:uncharacterized protein (UPF0218 family)